MFRVQRKQLASALTRRLLIRDLIRETWRRAKFLFGIGLEARIDAANHLDAGLRECGLSDCVVLGHEVELDGIANFCDQSVGGED